MPGRSQILATESPETQVTLRQTAGQCVWVPSRKAGINKRQHRTTLYPKKSWEKDSPVTPSRQEAGRGVWVPSRQEGIKMTKDQEETEGAKRNLEMDVLVWGFPTPGLKNLGLETACLVPMISLILLVL